MKKLNVVNKLAFNKAAVLELNQESLEKINGGTGFPLTHPLSCSFCVASSNGPGTINEYFEPLFRQN
jgi:hypothetical protein